MGTAALLHSCLLELVAVSKVMPTFVGMFVPLLRIAAMQQPLRFSQQILHANVAISFVSIPVDFAA